MREESNNNKQKYVSTQLTSAISIAIIIGMLAMFYLYTTNQKREILYSNEQAMNLVTQSILLNLNSIMLAGYADIAKDFADGLKLIPGITDVHITRIDGSEAFLDNNTIDEVNFHTGEEAFYPRDEEYYAQIILKDDPNLLKVIASNQVLYFYETVEENDFLTFYAPIENSKRCQNCHGDEEAIRGLIKVSTSLEDVQTVLDDAWLNTSIIFLVTGIIIVIATLSMVFESLIFPLNELTGAMKQVANGRLHLRAPISGNDEFTEIARNFNVMIHRIEHSYIQQRQEQDKLLSIVQTNQEGVICADTDGIIVLVNPAASKILNKKIKQLMGTELVACLNDEKVVAGWFNNESELQQPKIINLNNRMLNVAANTIKNEQDNVIGKSVRFQDITDELEIKNRLQQLSTLDSLTGLFNRRHFDLTVGIEIERSSQDKQQLSLLMLDIDFFKKVNDTHGHDVGDKVLVDISKILKNAVRSNDIPCRFGGEEFILLLPETNIENAMKLAERIRRKIENTEIGGIYITVSIGVSSVDVTESKGSDELLKIADTELYRAKDSGRNKVCWPEKSL